MNKEKENRNKSELGNRIKRKKEKMKRKNNIRKGNINKKK
jgi:hypothetical protein